jgi:broad specificity phosphatase PhoE
VQIHLIRHGQAGSRDNYDLLSDLGKSQARLLGGHFRAAGVSFRAAYTGGMRRQRETAEIVLGELPNPPQLRTDPRWNEFSLEGLWKTLAPRLLAENEQFSRDYEASHSGNPNLDRVMTACDVELIRAWMRSHQGCGGVEGWKEFRGRVESPRADLARFEPGESVAVFTSATPTAIWCGSALAVDERRIFHIAGVLYNTSFSTLRLRDGELTLFSLNNIPHLPDAALRTFR